MAGTTAMVCVLLGFCVVIGLAVVTYGRVQIAQIRSRARPAERKRN